MSFLHYFHAAISNHLSEKPKYVRLINTGLTVYFLSSAKTSHIYFAYYSCHVDIHLKVKTLPSHKIGKCRDNFSSITLVRLDMLNAILYNFTLRWGGYFVVGLGGGGGKYVVKRLFS